MKNCIVFQDFSRKLRQSQWHKAYYIVCPDRNNVNQVCYTLTLSFPGFPGSGGQKVYYFPGIFSGSIDTLTKEPWLLRTIRKTNDANLNYYKKKVQNGPTEMATRALPKLFTQWKKVCITQWTSPSTENWWLWRNSI